MSTRIKNMQEFRSGMATAFVRILQNEVAPMVKGVALEVLETLIQGDESYVGTPQWKGNAAANWYVTQGSPAVTYQEFFTEPLAPGDSGFDGEPSEYSARNPRPEAVSMSLGRGRSVLAAITGIPTKIFITNTAPQLHEFRPFGPGSRIFRAENVWPITSDRVIYRMGAKISHATVDQIARWKGAGR